MPLARTTFLSKLARPSPLSALRQYRRTYTVEADVCVAPKRVLNRVENVHDPAKSTSVIDSIIMKEFPRFATTCTPFGHLVEQYDQTSGNVLDFSLPYEPAPALSRRVQFDRASDAVVIVAHIASNAFEHKVSLCSGFAIDVPGHENSVIVSCAHTLEMMRSNDIHISPSAKSATLVVTSSMQIYPVSAILASLPRSDLIVYSLPASLDSLATLPVNPYPAPTGTSTRAHLVSLGGPPKLGKPWQIWSGGAIQSHWAAGNVFGYRDRAGRESKPGTYDTLAHILYSPIPTPGSSGGPIVDEESGAVVGVVTGHGMTNRVEGQRGFGTPAEAIFHMFALPGLSNARS